MRAGGTPDLSYFGLANKLLGRGAEPNFNKSICARQGLFSHSVVAGQDRILAPIHRAVVFGLAHDWIIIETFRIRLEHADRGISFVREDELCPGEGS